jgi:hypothetical protein
MTTIKSDIYECGNCHLIFAVPITFVKEVSCPECESKKPSCVASGKILIEAEH